MRLIKPYFEILSKVDGIEMLKNIELAGRTCYKSECKISEGSAEEFVRMIVKRGHESVLEHEKVTVRFICDRGVSHEIVRHRIASFSQESTRYCNYSKDQHISFIIPNFTGLVPCTVDAQTDLISISGHIMESATYEWLRAMLQSEMRYNNCIKEGWNPQQARSVLPNSLKTEIVVTANLREWRTIFKQRTSKAAHPQMRELMCPLLDVFKISIPIVFEDITY